jgi:hypothetical protein
MTRTLARCGLLLVALCSGATAHAALRSPQVPVSGTSLQTFFNSHSQAINVNTDQLDLQSVSFAADASLSMSFPFPNSASVTVGLYNAGFAVPPLYQCFPGAATNGWTAVASFRNAPTRVVVSLFDAGSAFQGSTTYLAGPPDRTNMGLYLQQGPADGGLTFYSQDVRNAGGARLLAFTSTGGLAGGTWLAWETGAGPGGDFADFVALVNLSGAPVPVSHTDWGTLKQRFH